MRVSVAVALPARQEVVQLELSGSPSVADAVSAAGVSGRFPQLDLAACKFALWGREVSADTMLRDGDRVELLRPLQADPKESRRQRVAAARGKDR
jgi:hypothetical protein